MKKILSLLLSCTICFATVVATGCKDNPITSEPGQTIERLELETETCVLTLGDTAQLSVSYNEIDGETPIWSSSSPDVVSVEENGCIEALKVGSSIVTVKYGTKKASCAVEVGLSDNVPVLAFVNNMRDEITLMKSSTYDFSACVQFNGKTFNDGVIEYFVADESIATVQDGKLTTKDVAGSTQVSALATWRGQTVRTKTVKVNVISESTVLLNSGRLNSVDIYTVAELAGKEYATSQIISSVFVSEDGLEIQDYTLSILDEGIASIEKSGEEWIVSSKKAGKTNLIVSYTDKEFLFDVYVNRPIADVEKSIDYSITDVKYWDTASKTLKPISDLVGEGENLTSYELLGKEYKIKNGVLDLPVGKSSTVILYNENVGYRMTMCAYTTIIDELKDFEAIYAGDSETDVTGAYMLAKDIIEPQTVLSMPSGKVPNNFAGTFDGKGHVLSFTMRHGEYKFGLFGQFLKGATIKNLALNNITKSGTAGKNPSGIICYEAFQNASECTLENIFVDLKFMEAGASNLAFMGNVMQRVVLKNVIIHVPTVPESDTYGAFARQNAASVSNSYVISTAPLYVTVQATNYKIVPTHYENYTEMKEADNDYSSFSTEFWDTTTYGIPVWKTLVQEFTY
ncbi:MAG: hypothetical protein IJX30_05545 [Clostridia bacterium]|nr:hypothetical protein [Clostridia bacterium]